MSNRGIRRWALLGALVSGALVTGCEQKNVGPNELDTWPKTGINEREGVVNDAQNVDSFGPEQPATGGAGFEQEPPQPSQNRQEPGVQGAPGYTSPREDGRGAEVLRDGQTADRNQGGEQQR
ncbi:MAG TPA: hypothetical protein VF815_36860 [Myxococcaceae bacterium]|jgi:hypothetical protein